MNLALCLDKYDVYDFIVRNDTSEYELRLTCQYSEIESVLADLINGELVDNKFNQFTFRVDGVVTYCILKRKYERSINTSIEHCINRMPEKCN